MAFLTSGVNLLRLSVSSLASIAYIIDGRHESGKRNLCSVEDVDGIEMVSSRTELAHPDDTDGGEDNRFDDTGERAGSVSRSGQG